MASLLCKSMTQEERKARVAQLVENFQNDETFYKSKSFVESEVRNKFIDPFLECLGWDVRNEKGARYDRREVITEDKIEIDGHKKSPDYSLCYGGVRKIYVEAKQPSVNVRENADPAFQVRRYAYTAKMPIAILTDFEEFSIYDTRFKPKKTDSAGQHRIFYCRYVDYLKNFDFLYDRLSWEAVDLGKFDSFYEQNKDKKGTEPVDDAILKMIEEWRVELAKDIARQNETIDEYDLTSVVQKIIDRIIFLRICEDKNIQNYGELLEIARRKKDIYPELQRLFVHANDKFNAGIFAPDPFLNSLKIGDKILCDMISQVYYPECPYEFSVLPVEILGTIYERFLGKIIQYSRKTKTGHSVQVIEKPEIQKAGGVYYTPSYIVRYIVEQTIGKKIEGKKPAEIAKMRFIDPACGSGSFLVGAYQYLLDYHLDYYCSTPEIRAQAEKKNQIYKDARTREYKLSVDEKKRILLNNLYGVDIDRQATEVTKLSLYLKLLEHEGNVAGFILKGSDLTREKLLPNLGDNIKCGNSLVGKDYFQQPEFDFTAYSKSDQIKINPFDWTGPDGFPDVFQNGGFDCVIGNPPYMRVQTIQDKYPEVKKYYENKYKSTTGRYDTYVLFLEKGFYLLNKEGKLSFIVPHKFTNSEFGIGIRQFLYENKAINFFLHFGSNMVFQNATTYTCIIGLSHNNATFQYCETSPSKIGEEIQFDILDEENLSAVQRWNLQNNSTSDVIAKILEQKLRLKDICQKISQGIVSNGDDIFYMSGRFEDDFFIGYSQELKQEVKLERDIMKAVLKGDEIKRYAPLQNRLYCIYPHHQINGKTVAYTEKELKTLFPLTYQYLSIFKKQLVEKKIRYKTNATYWYTLHRAREMALFEQCKIITPEISLGCNMTYDESNIYHNTKGYSIILKETYRKSPLAYLAILNSPILWYFLSNTGYVLRGGFFCFTTKYLEPFPIPELSEEMQNILTCLVEQMLTTQRELSRVKSASDVAFLQQKAEAIDAQINQQIYALYGLTDVEIAIIEGR